MGSEKTKANVEAQKFGTGGEEKEAEMESAEMRDYRKGGEGERRPLGNGREGREEGTGRGNEMKMVRKNTAYLCFFFF